MINWRTFGFSISLWTFDWLSPSFMWLPADLHSSLGQQALVLPLPLLLLIWGPFPSLTPPFGRIRMPHSSHSHLLNSEAIFNDFSECEAAPAGSRIAARDSLLYSALLLTATGCCCFEQQQQHFFIFLLFWCLELHFSVSPAEREINLLWKTITPWSWSWIRDSTVIMAFLVSFHFLSLVVLQTIY